MRVFRYMRQIGLQTILCRSFFCVHFPPRLSLYLRISMWILGAGPQRVGASPNCRASGPKWPRYHGCSTGGSTSGQGQVGPGGERRRTGRAGFRLDPEACKAKDKQIQQLCKGAVPLRWSWGPFHHFRSHLNFTWTPHETEIIRFLHQALQTPPWWEFMRLPFAPWAPFCKPWEVLVEEIQRMGSLLGDEEVLRIRRSQTASFLTLRGFGSDRMHRVGTRRSMVEWLAQSLAKFY